MTFTIPFPMLVGMWFAFGIICIVAATTFMCRVSKVSPSYTFFGYFCVVVVFLMTVTMLRTIMWGAEAIEKLGGFK